MVERLKAFLKSEELKRFFRKVLNKKVIITAIVLVVLITALRIAFSLMFEVKGTVLKVEGNNIVVANFLYTKTVDTEDLQVVTNKIQVGEKVKITKNLYGNVISIQGEHRNRGGYGRRNRQMHPRGMDGQNGFKGKESSVTGN